MKKKCKQCDIILSKDYKEKKCKRCINSPTKKKNRCAYCVDKIDHNEYDQKTYGNCCKRCNSVFVRRIRIKERIRNLSEIEDTKETLKDLNYQYDYLGNLILKRRLYNEYKQKSIDLKSYLAKIRVLKD